MPDSDRITYQEKGDDVLRRLLKTPPDKSRASVSGDKEKQACELAKNRRPAEDKG